jgi:iron complex transport system ATP-binding protein
VLELVADLRESRALTVMSAMHDLTVAGQYPDRLVLIDGGREAVSGPPAEVLTEELIARHYGASVRVVSDGDTIAVVPLRPRLEAEERIEP